MSATLSGHCGLGVVVMTEADGPRVIARSSVPRSGGGGYCGTDPHPYATFAPKSAVRGRTRRVAPSREIVEAVFFLLDQPHAYLYRRGYLELVTETVAADGATVTDYRVAEKYLLATAAACRRTLHRSGAGGNTARGGAGSSSVAPGDDVDFDGTGTAEDGPVVDGAASAWEGPGSYEVSGRHRRRGEGNDG